MVLFEFLHVYTYVFENVWLSLLSLLFYQQFFGWLLVIISHQIQKKVLVIGLPGPGSVHHPALLVAATVAVLGPGRLLHDPGLGRGHSGVHVRELLTVAPA